MRLVSLLIRPVLLFAVLCGFSAASQSQPAPGGGYNFLTWEPDSPKAVVKGVEVMVNLKLLPGWMCNDLWVQVIDNKTAKVLDEDHVMTNTGFFSKTYGNFDGNLEVRISIIATLSKGADFDVKTLEEIRTTLIEFVGPPAPIPPPGPAPIPAPIPPPGPAPIPPPGPAPIPLPIP